MPVPERPKKSAVTPSGAHVGRAVHGQHVALGDDEVHDAEDRFFHFAGIFGAADEDDLAREIGQDEGAGVGSVALRHGLEFRRGDDGELRHMRSQLLRHRGRTKSWRTKSACQAYSLITRMGSR